MGKKQHKIDNELKPKLTRERYPFSGRILIFQRSSELEGNSTTALLALRAATSWGSSTSDVLEPSAGASEVSSKISRLLSTRGITLYQWKFVMMAAAINSFFTRYRSVLVSTLSLA